MPTLRKEPVHDLLEPIHGIPGLVIHPGKPGVSDVGRRRTATLPRGDAIR
jgi:hypothetical protein